MSPQVIDHQNKTLIGRCLVTRDNFHSHTIQQNYLFSQTKTTTIHKFKIEHEPNYHFELQPSFVRSQPHHSTRPTNISKRSEPKTHKPSTHLLKIKNAIREISPIFRRKRVRGQLAVFPRQTSVTFAVVKIDL